MAMKYAHTNLNAKDWKKLRDFYCDVFEGKVVPPERDLGGPWFEKASGMKGAHVRGCHVAFPAMARAAQCSRSSPTKTQRESPAHLIIPVLAISASWSMT